MKSKEERKKDISEVFGHLDDACGSLDNAIMGLSKIEEIPQEIRDAVEELDITAIVSIKNKIESLQR